MRLKNIKNKNFRWFKQVSIDFDKHITLIVGKNGAGKTALLDAVAVSFNSFLLGIDGAVSRKILKDDARYEFHDLNGTIDPQHQLKGNEKYRARQNVVFEAGYFMGYLGRENVIMITEENLEIPWDLSGMVYTTKDNWKFEMLKELNAAGMKIDMNKLLG